MGVFRQFPVFWSTVVGCALAGVCCAWQLLDLRSQAKRLQQRLESERREYRVLETQALLAATAERDREIAVESERQTRRALCSALAHGEAALLAGDPAPGSRTEACASLAAMAQGLRELAASRGICVSPDECYGFAEYAEAGPEMSQLVEVHRQSRVVAAAVRLLVEAQPVEIRGVRRGRGNGPMSGSDGSGGLAGGTTVRLEFCGDTGVLREFLNRLARAEFLPYVRSVEAEPAQRVSVVDGDDSATTLISPGPMNYAVAIECIHLESGATAENSVGASVEVAVPSPADWLSPSRTGEEVTHCDLFTAPIVDYDPTTGKFSVRRIGEALPPPVASAPQAATVAEARREPYRVQLLGHVGVAATLVGTFADLSSGVTFLARAGQTVSQSAIAVRTLQRVRRRSGVGASNQTPEWVIVAEIDDLLTGETIMLTNESRKVTEVMR